MFFSILWVYVLPVLHISSTALPSLPSRIVLLSDMPRFRGNNRLGEGAGEVQRTPHFALKIHLSFALEVEMKKGNATEEGEGGGKSEWQRTGQSEVAATFPCSRIQTKRVNIAFDAVSPNDGSRECKGISWDGRTAKMDFRGGEKKPRGRYFFFSFLGFSFFALPFFSFFVFLPSSSFTSSAFSVGLVNIVGFAAA